MNAKQKLHQAKMTKWAALINQQLESGLSIKEWCIQNNQSFHAYNYWKHLIKESMVDSVIPDIVPIISAKEITPSSPSTKVVPTTSLDLRESHISPDLGNSRNIAVNPSPVVISLGDIHIEIGSHASDDVISGIIKAVRHAQRC
ncbi:MAG: hypothetical protein E7302_17920 [Butyrivibrio sp.]|jgi:hypothetical protein|nr:hypothetical protein [Butyrivibrio sp.]